MVVFVFSVSERGENWSLGLTLPSVPGFSKDVSCAISAGTVAASVGLIAKLCSSKKAIVTYTRFDR